MYKAVEQVGAVFEPREQSPRVLQPADRTFYDPAPRVASQRATVLGRRCAATATTRCVPFDAAHSHWARIGSAIGGTVKEQSPHASLLQQPTEQRLDERDLMRTDTGDVATQGQAAAIPMPSDFAASTSANRLCRLATSRRRVSHR